MRAPPHPCSRALVAAVPTPHPDQPYDPLPVKRGAPDARNPPSGCRFRDRCPHAHARCAAEEPAERMVDGRRIFCHLFDG